MNGLADLEKDIYWNERSMFYTQQLEGGRPYNSINQPLKFKENNSAPAWPAPELGEDTWNILDEIEYSNDAIAKLITDKIIGVWPQIAR